MFYIFGILLIIVVLIAYEKRKSDARMKNASERFWDKEREANQSRRKDISALPYITIPYEDLPLKALDGSEDYRALASRLYALSDKKILNLSGKTNTELKLEYGAANLPDLMQYDQNYLVVIRTVSAMAKLLYENGLPDEAESLLSFSLDIGCDVKGDYLLLADIYHNRRDFRSLDALIARAESLNSLTKESLLSSLYRIKNRTGTASYNPEDLFPPQ